MKKLHLLAAIILLSPTVVVADTTVFPPANCVSDDPQAIAYQVGADSTQCMTFQDMMTYTLKKIGCTEGQSLSLNAKKELSCKSNNVSAGWWSAQYVVASIPGNGNSSLCGGCQPDPVRNSGVTCPIERGCTWGACGNDCFTWVNCKIPLAGYKIPCDTYLGSQSVTVGQEFIYQCPQPHLDTGRCECPAGTSPVLYSQSYNSNRYHGGWDRTYKCK